MIFVKGIVISDPVRELDVDGRIAGFHQLQIDKQSAGSAVAVDKGMNTLKLNMEAGEFGYDVFLACGIVEKKLFHSRLDQIRLHGFMMRSHNADGNSSVNAPVSPFVGKDKIVDLFYGPETLTAGEVASLRQKAHGGRRLVYAYMSVGEAETYRYYWQREWQDNPPCWLAEANTDWQDNFKVKYWRPEWQHILYGSRDSYLDKIISAGFDGAFLDVVDAYYYFLSRESGGQD